MQFANANLGWATCDYDICKTIDGGKNWVTVSTGFPGWHGKLSVADEKSVFLMGATFNILKSTNEGNTWVDISPGITTQDFNYISYQFTDSLTGYIALEEKITGQGKLLKTVDGGQGWAMVDYGHYGLITAMDFYNSLHGVIHIVDNIFFVARDGGETWSEADSDPDYTIIFVQMTDTETVIATDRAGSHLVSLDGGSTFTVLYSEESNEYLPVSNSFYLNDLLGWKCGYGGMIKRFDLITSGVKDITPPLENITETLFWPNPSQNVIHIRQAGFENLSICSIDGKPVYYQRNDRIIDIDISQLHSGIYILTLYQQGKRNQEKLIIQ